MPETNSTPPFTHTDKKSGDIIRSEDWNNAMNEVMHLNTAKVNRKGADSIQGPLIIEAALTIKDKVGIATTDPKAQLQVTGTVNITSSNGSNYANPSNYMAPGSLTIGGMDRSYGGSQGWNSNTAGLLLETQDNTEIAVHDAGNRVASLMYYEGGAPNKLTIGRNMGWDAISTVEIAGALTVVGRTTTGNLQVQGDTELIGRLTSKSLSISDVTAQSNTVGKVGEILFKGFNRSMASAAISAESPSWDDQSHLIFKTSHSGAGATERLRITHNGNVGIATTDPKAQLQVTGTVNITSSNGSNYANPSNYMAPGSLTIGGMDRSYGGGKSWNSNTAGLLLETQDNTEIAVHDAGNRVASLMYYEGGASNNTITIGRDMGWGTSSVKTQLDLIKCGGRNDWAARNHPIATYFRDRLAGKGVGTMMMAICDMPSWERMVWQGYVDHKGAVWVNHLNWQDSNANIIG